MKWPLSRAMHEVKRKESSKGQGPEAGEELVCLRKEVSKAAVQ